MIDNVPPDTPNTKRSWWIVLAALGFVMLIALCLSTGLGQSLLSSAASALGISMAGPTEEAPTEPPTEVVSLEETPTQEITPPPTDEPTETVEPTEEATPEATETQVVITVGNGACFAACDPANPNCLAGLSCIPGLSNTGYICWSMTCEPTPIPPPAVCNPGEWTGCGGRPPEIVCPWNYVVECQANGTWGSCIWDPGHCEPTPVPPVVVDCVSDPWTQCDCSTFCFPPYSATILCSPVGPNDQQTCDMWCSSMGC